MIKALSKIPGFNILFLAFSHLISPPIPVDLGARRKDPYAHLYRFLLVEIWDIPHRKDLKTQEGLTLLFDE